MIGKKVLNYEIKSLLGEGGMGNVYLAEHTQLGRKVAIKVLHQQLVKNEQIRARFKNEASTMAHLQHPNIVGLFDYVEEADGLYLIMELVDGIPMDQFIRNVSGPIPADKAVYIMRQILDAVSYAHKMGVVHRDIKPANILLSQDMRVKILDFGIAKLFSEAHSLTKTGTQMGTVFYMSPEQVKGAPVDTRTDIYSLGVTFYQMLTGVGPYDGITTEYEVYNKIVNEPLPLPSRIYPGVPPLMDQVIYRATMKDPNQRFMNCDQFSQALTAPMPTGQHTVIYNQPPNMVPPVQQPQYNQPQFQQTVVNPGMQHTVMNPNVHHSQHTVINNPAMNMQQPKKSKTGLIVLIILLVLGGGGAFLIWKLMGGGLDPVKEADVIRKKYIDFVHSNIRENMTSFDIQGKMEEAKKKFQKELEDARKKFAEKKDKLNEFDNYYNKGVDSVNAEANKLFYAALASQVKDKLWVKEGDDDYRNYLINFRNDSVFLVNRKGAYTYTFDKDELTITGKGGDAKGKIQFNTLDEFLLIKEGVDTLMYRVAASSDSLVGCYTGSSTDYDEYYDYSYSSQKTMTIRPNGSVETGGSVYYWVYKDGKMKWNYKSGTEYINFGRWYLKNMNYLVLTGANINAMARVRAKQADSPSFFFERENDPK